jgi:hypothetical protein
MQSSHNRPKASVKVLCVRWQSGTDISLVLDYRGLQPGMVAQPLGPKQKVWRTYELVNAYIKKAAFDHLPLNQLKSKRIRQAWWT